MPPPEQLARHKIDAMLLEAGWILQNLRELNLAGKAVALREVPLKSGRCDYLMLINRKPVDVVETTTFEPPWGCWEQLDEVLSYYAGDLDRDVVASDQIRTVLATFRERVFTEMFPGRTLVPKTPIQALSHFN